MNEADNKIIDKIEKLIALSSSDNENEAKDAMLKAQELMAKYEIEMSQITRTRRRNVRSCPTRHRRSATTGWLILGA